MPRITKEMLEERIAYLEQQLKEREHRIEVQEAELKLLKSPYTTGGYLAALAIAAERLGDALAHVIADLKKKP